MITRAQLSSLKKEMEKKAKTSRYRKFELGLTATAEKLAWGPWESEFKFHPLRKWRADYCFPRSKLLVEIEGGFWSGGRHGRGGGAIKDMEKYNAAAILGYAVLRFTPQQANNYSALQVINDWFLQHEARIQKAIEFQITRQELKMPRGEADEQ